MMMKAISQALAMLFAVGALADAQTAPEGPAGTWEGSLPGATLVLKAEGAVLTGTVAGTDISEGRIEGNLITFKVQIPNGRTITFTGTLKGDEIALTREVKVPEGAAPGGAGILGAGGPAEFTVNRLVASSIWKGTVRNAPTPRNPNPNPVPRPVSLGTKKVPAPHWYWRGGEKQLEVRTFTLMGTFEVSLFELEGDRLSFSYTRPAGEVVCHLTRQADAQFKGTCQPGGGNNLLLIELTPPQAPAPNEAAGTNAR